MKILHVTPLYHPFLGGAESYTRELSERLAARGHDVTVLTMDAPLPPGDGPAIAAEVMNRVTVRRFKPAGRVHGLMAASARTGVARRVLSLTGHNDTADLWASSPFGMTPALYAARSRPDVVTVINWYDAWLPFQMALARRWRRFALVGIPLFHTECRWPRVPVHAGLLRQYDAVVAMTEHERAFMAAVTDRAKAIGVGVDPAAFVDADGSNVRRRYGIGDAPLVGYIGRMDASKGIDVLIHAMRTVWRVVPRARLLLAGGAATTQSSAAPDVPQAALQTLTPAERSRVIVTGRFSSEEKASLFDAIDVFAMPSRAESFGIAYLEAWMRKKPVIGSRLGSTGFVIDDGADGDLVAPGDADALASSILMLLTDEDRRHRFGAAGHRKAVDRFTWDAITSKVEGLYRTARQRAAPPPVDPVRRRLISWPPLLGILGPLAIGCGNSSPASPQAGGAARARYVSTDGSDEASGTIDSPWLTLAHAVRQLRPGDTLFIRGGVYSGPANVIDSEQGTVPSGSSWSRAVTIAAQPGELVVLRPEDGRQAIRLTASSPHHLVFRDLTIDMNGQTTPSFDGGPAGVYLSSGAHHNRFERLEVMNNVGNGFEFSDNNGNSPFNEVLNCSIHDNGRFPAPNSGYGAYVSTSDNLFEGNAIYGNGGYGVHLFRGVAESGVSRNMIRNNRIFDNGRHGGTNYGVVLASGDRNVASGNSISGNRGGVLVYEKSSNAIVEGNTIVRNSPLEGIFIAGAVATIVRGNTVSENATDIVDEGTGTVVS